MKRPIQLTGSLLLTLLLGACNAAMVGEQAPSWPAENWVAPDASPVVVTPQNQWVVVEFFAPT